MTSATAPYNEVAESELVAAGEYRQSGRIVKLCPEAAVALYDLMARAVAAGVKIVPISGFRSIQYQESLFQKAISRHGSEAAAARWVARPGYSEHHTGLAIDLGDEATPACDTEPAFEDTAAFHWLLENASRFGFEMSFPRNNDRGINYEPWHWCYVGTPEANQIFQK